MLIHKVVYQAIALAVLTVMTGVCSGQCSFIFDLVITDNSSQSVEINVAGLTNGDLSGTQSVCGVNLEFRHNYLGDLSIELQSPSGQSIKLVGDITDMINPTNLTTWNVGFLPCSGSPMPDAGFINTWNNDQAWEVFSNYTGTYFPFSGCFEDFNAGSANGTWELIVSDAAAPATGLLISAEIIFCDDTGLLCSVCPADAGEFEQTMIDVCDGDPIASGSFDIDYSAGVPDPNTTNTTYIISRGSQPVLFVDDPYAFNWMTGSYAVCALSYLVADSSALFSVIDTMTLSEIHMAVNDPALGLCGDVSDKCIDVVIHPIPPVVVIDESICIGQQYAVGDQSFDQPGSYDVMLTTAYGCDSLVRLNLEVLSVIARITQSDTLTCDMTTVLLNASSSTAPGVPSYQWGSQSGGIVGPSNTPSIQIAAPGVYSVTVTSLPSGCQSVRSWNVITDGSQPAIFIEDKIIDCNNRSVTLNPIVFPSNVSYLWTGPGGFTSVLKNPSVSEGGKYWLVATAPNGCSATQSMNVLVDTIAEGTFIRTLKDCESMSTSLLARPGSIDILEWSGPAGFVDNRFYIEPPVPGEYILKATYDNGCVEELSTTVVDDYNIPDLTLAASLDSLNCGESSLLTASSSADVEAFNWYGSFITEIDTPSISVFTPDIFAVEAIGANGCIGHDTIQIHAGSSLPPVIRFTDTLTCVKDTVEIGVITTAAIVSYSWTGPAVVDSFTDFIRVTAPGIYRVEMFDLSGCVLYGVVSVPEDRAKPGIGLQSDTLTCSNVEVELRYSSLDSIAGVQWYRGNAFLGSSPTLMVDQPGTYTISATGANGCIRNRAYVIPVDTVGPIVFYEPAQYGCHDSLRLNITPIDSVVQYEWSGVMFESNVQDPFIFGPGTYYLTATAKNGCSTITEIQVPLAAQPPLVDVTTELLDCIDSMAVFRATSPDTSATFQWFDDTPTMISDSGVVQLFTPGVYELVVTGYNNCETRDTASLAPPVTPAIYSEPDTINCRDKEVELLVQSDSSMMSFSWFDSEGAPVNSGPVFRVASPGVYTIVGVWSNGCQSDTTVRVYIDTIRPTAVAVTDEVVRCEIRELHISGAGSIGDSLSYHWDALSGMVLLGENRDSAFVQGPGEFVLTVVEQINHCSDTDTLLVEEEPSTLRLMDLTIVPECQGNLAGAIIFDSVYSADSPLQYSIGLNGGQSSAIFDSLVQGQYHLSVVDSFGCRLDSIVFVTETSSEATVNLGADQEVLIGDRVLLNATLDVDSSSLSAIFWEPSLPCDSCLSNEDEPVTTTDYVIYVRDEFGCLAQDEVRVYVIERGQLYVPNIFTPNGDGTNDEITVTAHPGVRLIKEFSIFDRWGDLMFRVTNVDPHTSSITWDGKFGGKELNPAVYSYVMKIELITGRNEILTGDITLLR